jgi:hypothetical protein
MDFYSNHRGVQMQRPKTEWQKDKLVHIFQRYHSAIRARSREGRQYAMRCFYAVLVYEGMSVEKLGPYEGQPFDPATGAGYLLVENAFALDVVCMPHITLYTILRTFPQIPTANRGMNPYKRFVFNFGSAIPDWYPRPMDEDEWEEFFNRCWFSPMPTSRVSLALSQPVPLKWEAPHVR